MTGKAIALALIAVTASTALLANSIEYPPDNAEFFLQLSGDFKTKTNPDGSLIGIGPKMVIALSAMSGVKDATAAKARLPELTRSRSEEHTSELQSRFDLVCRLLLEKKKKRNTFYIII